MIYNLCFVKPDGEATDVLMILSKDGTRDYARVMYSIPFLSYCLRHGQGIDTVRSSAHCQSSALAFITSYTTATVMYMICCPLPPVYLVLHFNGCDTRDFPTTVYGRLRDRRRLPRRNQKQMLPRWILCWCKNSMR